jgi:hypothetical protein
MQSPKAEGVMTETIQEAVPHPLTTDGWMPIDGEEHATVRNSQIADVQRAVNAIKTIGRLLHNSLGEPDGTGSQPLDRGTEIDLADALICLGDYAYDRVEDMNQTAQCFLQYERERGENHG